MPEQKTILEMSLEEIEERYGVKAKPAKISRIRGKYYLTVEAKRSVLEPNFVICSKPIEELLGESIEVRVIIPRDGPVVIVVPRRRAPCYMILCYIPVPDIRVNIDRALRTELVKRLVKENVLPSRLGKQLVNDIAGGL